jgi:hypothetical protein
MSGVSFFLIDARGIRWRFGTAEKDGIEGASALIFSTPQLTHHVFS